MKRSSLYLLLMLAMLCIFALVACSGGDGGTETGTDTGTGTKAETEAVTAVPRYDYISADVLPDVDIKKEDYMGVALTIPNGYRIEEDDVQTYIDYIRFNYRTAENGAAEVTDKAIKLGDTAYVYYKGYLDGKEFDGGSNWDDDEPIELGIGSQDFIPGFEAALIGIVPKDTSKDAPAEIKVTFPEDYGKEELNGKEATFQIVITKSVQYKVPDYTKEFVLENLEYETEKAFYASDKAIFTEFESFVRNQMEADLKTEIENAKVGAIWDYLSEKVPCKNLPADEVEFYYDSYKSELEGTFQQYSAQAQFKELYPDVDSFAVVYLGLEKGADWKAELRRMSELMVKKDMITHAIGELEGIESVTDEEYQAQINYWVEMYYGYMTSAEIEKNMGKTFLIQSAFADKMKDWLLEAFVFTYEDGSPIQGESADTESETTVEPENDTVA